MTRDSMLELLRKLEWSGQSEHADDYCPSCHATQVLPNESPPPHIVAVGFHCADCKLAEAIAWLEDEGKRETVYCQIGGPTDGWLLKEKV